MGGGYVRVDLRMKERMNLFGCGWIWGEGDKIVGVYRNYWDKGVKVIEGREGWDSERRCVMIYR